MAIGLLGKKLGMTHVYDDYGRHVTVTVVQAGPCTVLGLREPKRHGYQAVQVGFETVVESKVTKPRLGQFKQAGAGPFRHVHEFRLPAPDSGRQAGVETEVPKRTTSDKQSGEGANGGWSVGQQLTVELFKRYELVDVTGTSIGKGFQGGMKRWGWSGGPETHGSMSHRAPGSIGSSTFPARVFRGHHLPGHMGARRVTVENLRIVGLDREANLLLIEGAIPGPERSLVIVEKSTKRFEKVKAPQAIVEVVGEEEDAAKKTKAKKKE